MLIFIHVVLALSALSLSVLANVRPDKNKLRISYGLAVGTLASGISLIVINNASVVRTCLTGLLFFIVVSVLNEFARHRLVTENSVN